MRGSALQIAVIGAANRDARLEELARAVGAAIAGAGATLLCGGRSGVMEAAAAGARANGGATVGILPGATASETPANPHIEIAIYTGMGQARNQILVLSADAVIGVGGGWGTLSEIALALKHRVSVVLLESWDLTPPDGSPDPLLQTATEPQAAVAMALEAGRERARSRQISRHEEPQ